VEDHVVLGAVTLLLLLGGRGRGVGRRRGRGICRGRDKGIG
jgi:hypothetical protein